VYFDPAVDTTGYTTQTIVVGDVSEKTDFAQLSAAWTQAAERLMPG
jgi:hypothetical protein